MAVRKLTPCAVDGCDRPNFVGLCWLHKQRQRRTGITGLRPKPTELERFWASVDKRGPDECWPWTGAGGQGKHGRFQFNGRLGMASHYAWILEYGPVPYGLFVCHHCDFPPCVNVAHLFLGTQYDNMRDRHSKNKYAYGEKHPMAKLTEAAVRLIRCDRRELGEIASDYGVTSQAILLIRRRRTWKHIR